MSVASVGRLFRETCHVLWKRLSERGFIEQLDSTTAEWRNIAKEYEKYWNIPNQCPARGGSMYFNKTFIALF